MTCETVTYADETDVREGDAVLLDGDELLPAEQIDFRPMSGWYPARVSRVVGPVGYSNGGAVLEIQTHWTGNTRQLVAEDVEISLTLVQRDSRDYVGDSLSWLRARAKEGNARARFGLGILMSLGRHVTKDPALGLSLLKTAAEEGEPRALHYIGELYATSRQGLKSDLGLAVQCYRQAAELGYAPAQYVMGPVHEHGRGATQDLAKAERWYRQAANKGNPAAQHQLISLYHKGALRPWPPAATDVAKWLSQLEAAQNARVRFSAWVRHERRGFVAGTLVHTQEGLVPIEQIKVGDWVLSQPENKGEKAYKRVTQAFVHDDQEICIFTIGRTDEENWEVVFEDSGYEHRRSRASFLPMLRSPAIAGSWAARGEVFWLSQL